MYSRIVFAALLVESLAVIARSCARVVSVCWNASHATRSNAISFLINASCALSAARFAGDRGSLVTVTFSLRDFPLAVRRTVYVAGGTTAPWGEAGVSPGFALISNVCVNAGGAS